MTDYEFREIGELSDAIKTGAVSPVEITEQMLARAASLNPRFHAYQEITAGTALEQAREAEREIRAGNYRGSLHGIPLAVKDNIDVAGVATTNGLKINDNFVPRIDSSVVRKLKTAGAVLLGKLAHTEGAFAEHRPDTDPPVNPWDEDQWVGASSSGPGSAVAAQMCYAALGSDTGGSIRFPCAVNNLTGMKPTWGRVSRFGVRENSASMDHIGPMARSAADVAIVLEAIAGSDPYDPTASRHEVPSYQDRLAGDVRGLRIGIDRQYAFGNVDPDTVRAIEDALEVFCERGAVVSEIALPDSRAIVADWLPLSGVEMASAHLASYPSRASEYGQVLRGLIELGHGQTGIEYFQRTMRRTAFRAQMAEVYEGVDAVIVPTISPCAPTLKEMDTLGEGADDLPNLVRFTAPSNMTGNPAMIIPGGFTVDGWRPLSFQLIGRHFEEDLILRLAHAYQQETDWHLMHAQI
jgi:amidase